MNKGEFKSLIINQMIFDVEEKIQLSKDQINSINQSKSSATKSSAGDKHETSRAMMERELVMAKSQHQKSQQQKLDIENLQKSAISTENIGIGSFIHTTTGYFILGIGLGKIEVEGSICFAISPASPIGKNLLGKKVGDSFEFNGSIIEIISIK